MYAKITKDHLFDGDIIDRDRSGAVIIRTGGELTHTEPTLLDVRLYDDDDELYYEAIATDDALEDLFDWAQRDSGVTKLDVKRDGEWKVEIA